MPIGITPISARRFRDISNACLVCAPGRRAATLGRAGARRAVPGTHHPPAHLPHKIYYGKYGPVGKAVDSVPKPHARVDGAQRRTRRRVCRLARAACGLGVTEQIMIGGHL